MKAADTNNGNKIYWYIDNKYMGVTTQKHDIETTHDKGWPKLQIVDAEGHNKEVLFLL